MWEIRFNRLFKSSIIACSFLALFTVQVHAAGEYLWGNVADVYPGGEDLTHDLAIQPDGKIVIVGESYNGDNNDFSVVRFHPNGSKDSTFGTSGNGILIQDFANNPPIPCSDNGRAVSILPDGHILVAGDYFESTSQGFALAKIKPQYGELDTTGFGVSGEVRTEVGQIGRPYDMAVFPNGKIVLAGYTNNGSTDIALAQYHPDGSLDTSFGSSGTVVYGDAVDDEYVEAVAVQSDGKIVVAGFVDTATGVDLLLTRFLSNGNVDTAFGSGGKIRLDAYGGDDYFRSVLVQPDGKILAGGTVNVGSSTECVFYRSLADGSPDLSFGIDGLATANFSGSNCNDFALQVDGKIVGVGSKDDGYSVMRFRPDGTVDTTFGSAGITVKTFTSGGFPAFYAAVSVALNGNGDIILGGNGRVYPSYVANMTIAKFRGGLSGKIIINDDAVQTTDDDVSLALTCLNSDSGCSEMRFSNDGLAWGGWQPFADTANWTLMPGDGDRAVYVQFRDSLSSESDIYSDSIYQDYNYPPVVTGQAALAIFQDNDIVLSLDALSVTDPDNSFPTEHQLIINSGPNFRLNGDTVSPDPGFAGELIIPLLVNDGRDSGPVFDLRVTVYADSDGDGLVDPAVVPGSLWNAAVSYDGSFNITWGGSTTTAVQYLVQEANQPDFSDARGIYLGPDTALTVSGRGDGTYYFRVKARAVGYLDSPWLERTADPCVVTIIPSADMPKALWNPVTSGTGTYAITWGGSTTPGVEYLVQEATDVGFTQNVKGVYLGASTGTTVNDRTDASYYYRVKARAAGHFDSDWLYRATPCAVAVIPTADSPKALWNPASSTNGNYTVTWGGSTTPGVKYLVQEATDAGFTQNVKGIYLGAAASTTVGGRGDGIYYYRVKARAAGYQDSDWHYQPSPCTVTLPPMASSPSLLSVPNFSIDGSISLNWSSVSHPGAQYLLQEATQSDFSDARGLYLGPDNFRSLANRSPGGYYYRVKVRAPGYRDSDWAEGNHSCVYQKVFSPSWISYPSTSTGSHVVTWGTSLTPAVTYILEEASDVAFSDAVVVYSGPDTSHTRGFSKSGSKYYRVRAVKGADSSSRIIRSIPVTFALGEVSEIVASSDSRYVYALDKTYERLYRLNIAEEIIDQSYNLPYADPVAVDYSVIDNRLYIVSASSGDIVVFDVATENFSEIEFSTTEMGRDIAVAPSSRRAYVLSDQGVDSNLFIVDLATDQVIHSDAISGNMLVVHDDNQWVFTASTGTNTFSKYSVSGDLPVLLQSVSAGAYKNGLKISNDGSHVLVYSNTYTDRIYDYDSSNIDNVYGDWDVGKYPVLASFSPDRSRFYGVNGYYGADSNLSVMSTDTYQLVKKIPFPNAYRYAVFNVSDDGSTIVGFSYNNNVNTEHAFVFFKDLTGDVPPASLGVVSDMVAGDDPNYVYALDKDAQKLYRLNISAQQADLAVDLPYSQPLAMDFSDADNALYIVSNYSGAVVRYNIDTGVQSEYIFSYAGDGRDIAVAPNMRRIYVLYSHAQNSYLSILDMDTGEVLDSVAAEGDMLVASENNQAVFTASLLGDILYKYTVISDQPVLLQSVSGNSNAGSSSARSLEISPDGNRVIMPSYWGNGPGNTIFDYDATDLNNVIGEWNVGKPPEQAKFSPDGTRLFGAFDFPSLFVMTADTYQVVKELPFPNANYYSVITSNSDGSTVVGFSYYTNNNTGHTFTYFKDLSGTPPPASLGVVSDMVAGNDPNYVYALDQDAQKLYRLNISSQQTDLTVELPYVQPLEMDYSTVDNALYIVSRFSGNIVKYDISSGTLSELSFSYAGDGRDIAVAPAMRRIYVLSSLAGSSYLTILDMDTGTVLNSGIVAGDSLDVHETNEWLFASSNGLDTLSQYNIANDQIALLKSVPSPMNSTGISLSPGGDRVVVPYYDAVGKIPDFDTANLDNVVGEWNVRTGVKKVMFSPNGTDVLAVNGLDSQLYVLTSDTYQLVKKVPFPNAYRYSVFTPNSDGTAVVGFSYYTVNNTGHAFTYMTDLTGVPDESLGIVSDMASGDDPNYVYALDQDRQKLYRLNIATQQTDLTITLPSTQPLAMDYSIVDNALYIVSKFSGSVVKYDIPTGAQSEIVFSSAGDGRDIAVAPFLRRVYVLYSEQGATYLGILDMDTENVLYSAAVDGDTLIVDENSEWLFTASLAGDTVNKYSVANDQLSLLQTVSEYINSKDLSLSPDGMHLAVPAPVSWGAIVDYNPSDLTSVFGEWSIGYFPRTAEFSPDGSRVFAVSGYSSDNTLHVLNASDYQEIRKLAFSSAWDYAVISSNSDGTAVVGFSCNDSNRTGMAFYFFTDVAMP